MSILGIDYGRAHMGIAWGDPETKLALPRGSFSNLSRAKFFAQLQKIITTESITTIVLGVPLSKEPNHEYAHSMREEVEAFRIELQKATNVPVVLIDERFTSKAATVLRQENPTADEHALSAMLILETYFAKQDDQ